MSRVDSRGESKAQGLDVNSVVYEFTGKTYLHECLYKDVSVLVKALASGGNPTLCDKKGNTPLHDAVMNYKNDHLSTLLASTKCRFDILNSDGDSVFDLTRRLPSKGEEMTASMEYLLAYAVQYRENVFEGDMSYLMSYISYLYVEDHEAAAELAGNAKFTPKLLDFIAEKAKQLMLLKDSDPQRVKRIKHFVSFLRSVNLTREVFQDCQDKIAGHEATDQEVIFFTQLLFQNDVLSGSHAGISALSDRLDGLTSTKECNPRDVEYMRIVLRESTQPQRAIQFEKRLQKLGYIEPKIEQPQEEQPRVTVEDIEEWAHAGDEVPACAVGSQPMHGQAEVVESPSSTAPLASLFGNAMDDNTQIMWSAFWETQDAVRRLGMQGDPVGIDASAILAIQIGYFGIVDYFLTAASGGAASAAAAASAAGHQIDSKLIDQVVTAASEELTNNRSPLNILVGDEEHQGDMRNLKLRLGQRLAPLGCP